MADSYIDNDEIHQVYGPHACKKMKQVVQGMVAEFDDSIEHQVRVLLEATRRMKVAVGRSRDAGTELARHAAEKGEALAAGVDALVRFGSHLGSHRAGTV